MCIHTTHTHNIYIYLIHIKHTHKKSACENLYFAGGNLISKKIIPLSTFQIELVIL